jgi:hypothetical protein
VEAPGVFKTGHNCILEIFEVWRHEARVNIASRELFSERTEFWVSEIAIKG